jgi:copper chaperone CopZ
MHAPEHLGVVVRGGTREIPTMRLEILIDGMVAVHARHAVFTALSAVEGVQRAEVELGRVVLELGPAAHAAAGAPGAPDAEAREQEIVAAVEAVGFTVREVRRLPRTLPTL